jgi:hypothetical protein
MRTIAGALLIVAASVCLGAGVIGLAIRDAAKSGGFDPSSIGFFAAVILGAVGLALLGSGLVTERKN